MAVYTFSSRIRFSEADADGVLRLSSLIDYFQDCSTFQSEDVGYGVKKVLATGHAWVVNAWQIEIRRLPHMGDNVTIGTNPYEFRGFMGLRNFFMASESGEKLALANSVWSYLNLENGQLERAPEEMKEAYGIGEKLEMEYLSRKIPFPTDGEIIDAPQVCVQTSHLDANRHVNNGQFIKIAMEAAFGDTDPAAERIRAEYKMQAHLGDVFYPRICRGSDGVVTIALNDAENKVYCSVEVKMQKKREAAIV